MKYAITIYIGIALLLAWWDFDFDATSQRTAESSLTLQTMYMSNQQKFAYLEDFDLAKSQVGTLGLSKLEVHEIQEIANKVRIARKQKPIETPSKSITEAAKLFVLMPFFLATAN